MKEKKFTITLEIYSDASKREIQKLANGLLEKMLEDDLDPYIPRPKGKRIYSVGYEVREEKL